MKQADFYFLLDNTETAMFNMPIDPPCKTFFLNLKVSFGANTHQAVMRLSTKIVHDTLQNDLTPFERCRVCGKKIGAAEHLKVFFGLIT